MTPLEIALIAIIWIAYGFFAAYQTDEIIQEPENFSYIWYIIFAPLVFILKALYGAFKKYE